MDDFVAKQLTRQLKLLNFWVSFFGVIFLLCFIVAGVIAYKAVHELHTAETNFTSFQQKTENDLNVQQKLCSNSSISSFLKSNTNECK